MSLSTPVLTVQGARALSGTGTTNGPEIGVASAVDWVAIQLNVTAVGGTGTPTLAAVVQWSMDGGQTWAAADTADSFTSITATGAVVKRFPVKGTAFRLVETLTGTTPSFTYTLSALSR